MILEQLKADRLAHRKAKRKFEADILATLLGDIAKSCGNKKEATDEICIKFIKKFKANAVENASALAGRGEADSDSCAGYKAEAELLSAYLPVQMSAAEVTGAVVSILAGLPQDQRKIGVVMGQLGKKYKGLYDGKMAKEIIESKI